MINFLKDIYNYFSFKRKETDFPVGFFCENSYIFEYLKPYIINKSKKKKVVLISFEKLNFEENDRIKKYVFNTNFFRELLFLTLKLNYLYSSTTDLGYTTFKKSKFYKCKYIFLQHAPVSLTMVYNEKAFDLFDAVQAVNIYQFREMKEMIVKKSLKTKVFKGKYLFLSKYYKNNNKITSENIDLLIAPSWNTKFYQLNCHLNLKQILEKKNIRYILRPHPMSIKKKEISLNDLKNNEIPFDISPDINLKNFNFLVSDWSGIFIEFAIINKRKAFLINTPKKIKNKNYTDYKNMPIEILLRNDLGKAFDINELEKLANQLISNKNNFNNSEMSLENENINKKINETFYI